MNNITPLNFSATKEAKRCAELDEAVQDLVDTMMEIERAGEKTGQSGLGHRSFMAIVSVIVSAHSLARQSSGIKREGTQ